MLARSDAYTILPENKGMGELVCSTWAVRGSWAVPVPVLGMSPAGRLPSNPNPWLSEEAIQQGQGHICPPISITQHPPIHFSHQVSHLGISWTGKSLCFPPCFRFITGSGKCSVLQPKPLPNSVSSKNPFTCICNRCCSKTLEKKEPQDKMPKNTQPRGQAVDTAMPAKDSSRNFSPASGQELCSSEPAQHAGCLWISRAAPACWDHRLAKAYFNANSCWINKH